MLCGSEGSACSSLSFNSEGCLADVWSVSSSDSGGFDCTG